jgi:hypothetical protein
MAKTPKIKVERPAQIVKPVIAPVTTDIKEKIATAFQSVVTAIKTKHLS